MRRTLTTDSAAFHGAEDQAAVDRSQRHSSTTAKKSYTVHTNHKALKDFQIQRNVKSNRLICEEALENLETLFPCILLKPFPSIEDVETKLCQETTHQKYVGSFKSVQ